MMRLLLAFGAVFALVDVVHAGVARFQCRVTYQRDTLNLEFVHDTTTNKANMIGNAGMSEVYPHTGSRAVTFLELLPTGAVQSTTIALATGAAVHSRHSMVANEFVPTQYRGTCTSQGTSGTK